MKAESGEMRTTSVAQYFEEKYKVHKKSIFFSFKWCTLDEASLS